MICNWQAEWFIEDKKPKPEWPEKGMVQFNDLAVRYREGLDLVLKGISCDIKGGEKVSIGSRLYLPSKSNCRFEVFHLVAINNFQWNFKQFTFIEK